MAKIDPTEVREQRAIFYFDRKQANDPSRTWREMYPHMFVEDVSHRLFPASARRRESKVAVEILPANEDVERMITEALDGSNRHLHFGELDGALSEFLRLTMVELCHAGRAIFEIVMIRPKAGEPPVRFELFHINPRQIVERRGHLHQVIETDVARKEGVDELIFLPPENLAVFTLPPKLAGSIASTMEALSLLSDQSWHNLALEAQNGRLPYDFSLHARSMDLALGEAVRDIGWMARGSFNNKIINYYSLRQELRFKLFEVEVREALLTQLNAVLKKIGPVFGWSAAISVTGLSTRTDLERALEQLASGAVPFTEIFDSIREK